MKVKSIKISGMHNYDNKEYNLNDFTYFFGNNGAGKSTVLQAIQFALLGYIPGYNKTPAGVFGHCNNDKKMSVTLTLTDGKQDIVIVRECSKNKTGSATISTTVEPQVDIGSIIDDIESPVFNFNEFITMTANKLKEWFISFLGSNNDELGWDKVFTLESGTDVVLQKQLIEYTKDKPVDVDNLKDVNTYLKSIQTNKKAELDRITSTVQNIVHYDDIDISSEDLDALHKEMDELNAKKSYIVAYEERVNHNKIIQAKLSSAEYKELADNIDNDDKYYSLLDRVMDSKESEETINDTIKEITNAEVELVSAMKSLKTVMESSGTCPYTQSSCNEIAKLKDSYSEQYKDYQTKLESVVMEKDKFNAKLSELNSIRSNAVIEINRLKQLYQERDNLSSSLMPVTDAPEYTVVGITDKISELSDRIIKAETNIKYYAMIDTLTKDKLSCENSLNMIKEWIKTTGANGLQGKLTAGAFDTLSGNMDKYIQSLYGDSSLQTRFILEEKANSFSIGLVRNEKYIPYDLLSAGERCIFTLAMLLCLVENASSDLKLILIDDLLDHLDNDKIKTLFKGLNKIENIQIILAGVKPYTENNSDKVVITVA